MKQISITLREDDGAWQMSVTTGEPSREHALAHNEGFRPVQDFLARGAVAAVLTAYSERVPDAEAIFNEAR